MTRRRVVVTGVGVVSPIGNSLDAVSTSLRQQQHGIVCMPEWDQYSHLKTRLAAPVVGVDGAAFPRTTLRTVGRVGLLALSATDAAITDAGLDTTYLRSGKVGLAYGSTNGSSAAVEDFAMRVFPTKSLLGLPASSYLKFMSHTCAANLAMHFGIQGRIVSTCAACVSGSQGIGYGYEAIKFGMQEAMICGGAEELHFTHAGVFDVMFATSTRYNDRPACSPRPFDAARDGLVVGEGAATLVLESLDSASARGAHIYAEVLGFGTNCDGGHLTNPSAEGMAGAIRLALADAQLAPAAIDYVNAHGTATELGDIAESVATLAVLGSDVPVSSTKSYCGHTLGAAGSIEAVFCLAMLRDGFVPPTRNLEHVDPRCAPLHYVRDDVRSGSLQRVMSNNFAFGGINTSLVFGRP